MAIKHQWVSPEKIIYLAFHGNLDVEGVQEADRILNEYIEMSTADKVHIIIDDTDISGMPPISSLRALTITNHPKLGWTMIYGNKNAGLRFTTNLATRLLRFNFKMTESFEASIEYLQAIDNAILEIMSPH